MIDFQELSFSQKDRYQALRREDPAKGCEFSFNNIFMWGNQRLAFVDGFAAIQACFDETRLYPYPMGSGDRKKLIETLMEDAKERGIPFRLSGMSRGDMQELEALFPGKFRFRDYRNGADYIYDIHQLADMPGRKMQKKRNHVNKFLSQHPGWHTEPMSEEMLPAVKEMAARWYRDREAVSPEGDYAMEKTAMERGFDHFEQMGMEGIVLKDGEEMLAFTMGSRMCADTFDTHFEKAREDVEGAYAMINRQFARYLREKHPELRFIDREDDMGLPGLRKAKLSYNPHHLIEKGIAFPAEEEDLNDD